MFTSYFLICLNYMFPYINSRNDENCIVIEKMNEDTTFQENWLVRNRWKIDYKILPTQTVDSVTKLNKSVYNDNKDFTSSSFESDMINIRFIIYAPKIALLIKHYCYNQIIVITRYVSYYAIYYPSGLSFRPIIIILRSFYKIIFDERKIDRSPATPFEFSNSPLSPFYSTLNII